MPALLKKQSISAVFVERRFHVALHVGGFGDVGARRNLASPPLLAEECRRCPRRTRFVAVHHDHLGAALGEAERGRPADAAAAARDDRHFAAEIQSRVSPPCRLADDVSILCGDAKVRGEGTMPKILLAASPLNDTPIAQDMAPSGFDLTIASPGRRRVPTPQLRRGGVFRRPDQRRDGRRLFSGRRRG